MISSNIVRKTYSLFSKSPKGRIPVNTSVLDTSCRIPAIILMHEYWGPENILNQATEWFCPKNYNLLVPDLYRGNLVEDFKRSQNYILTTKPDVMGAMEDVKSTVKFAKDKLKATKVGIVGLSMGGALAMCAGLHVEGIECAVSFYGIIPDRLALLKDVKIPMQYHFGDKDALRGFTTPKEVNLLKEKLEKWNNSNHEIFMYENARHSFANESTSESYNDKVTQIAKSNMFPFLERHLKT